MFKEEFSRMIILSTPICNSICESPGAGIRLDHTSRVITKQDVRTSNAELKFPAPGKVDRCGKVSAAAWNDPL